VISNADAIGTYRNLIPEEKRRIYTNKKLAKIEPSCGGFVLLLGTNKKFDQLAHHNIFFSDDYRAEFEAIFETKTLPENPTIYICATSRTDETQAPAGKENLFILINAPYTSDRVDWQKERSDYPDKIIEKLESFGLDGLRDSIEYREVITPEDFEQKYRANKGSIYGVSSNGIFSAFMRVSNMAKDIEGLYFVGGTTHPGGGMPLVLLSGKMACDLITGEE
jgi:phytoene desaturase